jgi:uncharacterized phage protein gp47/JayE
VVTPQQELNLPGLSGISYRAGTWASFKESMLARLSSADYPALAPLKTRDDDDFTIAFLDATAVVLDILTFYQERLANESYLRTAVQLESLVELSRLIGYQPAPGVSASVYVAFTLKAAPGFTPDPTTPAITIPAGSQVQSVPPQGEKPQTFETSADIPAKPDWNALQVQTGIPWLPRTNDTFVYLQGTTTQLQTGDFILIVGDERAGNKNDNHWDVRVVTTVTPDPVNQRTYVQWAEGLGGGGLGPSQSNPRFYALRQRAALFGYNAINPRMLDTRHTQISGLLTGDGTEWAKYFLTSSIDLDSAYSKIVHGGWLVMIHPDAETSRIPPGFVSLYFIDSVSPVTRSDFAQSAKITRVFPDLTGNLGQFPLNTTMVVAQSEQLAVDERPLTYPLYGTMLDLETLHPDLVGAQVVAISGKSQKIAVADGVTNLRFAPDDNPSSTTPLNPGDVLTVTQPPAPNTDGSVPDWSTAVAPLTLSVLDASGRPGSVQASLSNFTFAATSKTDPYVEECALVSSVLSLAKPFPHTRILLAANLLNCYDRGVTTVNANVALATHGQSVSEVMGSGSASTPDQEFTLKQSPLTYVQAPTPTGRKSTLQVVANSVAWTEVPSLYQQNPSASVFATLNESDGSTDVLFGDGVEGATLPTGQNNIQANYRVGSGSQGNVAAGTITTLIDRPLGVSGVTNPQTATGGQDPQSVDDVRANAPQTVLTLGRAVSIADYQNYAATFAGIAKAQTLWIPGGKSRGVFLTVAGVGGAALPPGNPTLTNLVTSLQNYGNPLIPISAQSFLETLFGLSAELAYDPAYDQPSVQAAVQEMLATNYSFTNRTFGQGVTADEVAADIQGVPGVVAVNVSSITPGATSAAGDLAGEGTFSIAEYINWLSQQVPLPRPPSPSPLIICPYMPVATPQSAPYPAEILVLDPNPVNVSLGIMQ